MQVSDKRAVAPGSFRSKRARYAFRACSECQRRKVKCDGREPCARCAGQSFPCTYEAPNRRKPARERSGSKSKDCSQDDLGTGSVLKARSVTVSSSTPPQPPTADLTCPQRNASRGRKSEIALNQSPFDFSADAPDFSGPTSTEYTFNAVNGKLRDMGMQSAIPGRTPGCDIYFTSSSSRLAQYGPFIKLLTMDPLWDVAREDAITLIDDWCEGLGSIYPIVGRQAMLSTASTVFDALDKARLAGLRETGDSVAEALLNHDTNKLKIVLAIGMTKDAGGRQHQAQRLFQSASEAVEGLIWNPEGLQGIQLLFLVAMYHYHLNEEVRTGRCIAFAARLCLETGLHRRAMLERIHPDPLQCMEALHAFWAVYMLERRLSLGQGIPFSIQDSYIDQSLCEIDLSNPLLMSLLHWTRLAGKTWHALNSQVEKSDVSRIAETNCLDYEITQWFDQLPEEYKLRDLSLWALHQPTYYHSVFFVRKAHLRNLVYRPVLQLPVKSDQYEPILLKSIEVSKDTIRTLFHLNENSSLIRTHPMFFQQLLLTAFGNMLLAVVSTGPRIRNSTREEFDMFLQLFQLLSSECVALRRTWQRLQGLRDLHSKMNHTDQIAGNSRQSEWSAATQVNAGPVLRFEDIFPNIDLFATPADHINTGHQSNVTEANPYINYLEGFADLESLFNFPFLSS